MTASVAAIVLAITLAGCTGATEPAKTSSAPTDEPTATATPTPEPTLIPDGTAEDNLPLFTRITEQVAASADKVSGRAYIDALVAAGFDKKRMQVTEDRSTVDNAAESLQFSVAWGDAQCLVGQVGPSTGVPVTAVMEQLAEGRCLIGNTRTIDW